MQDRAASFHVPSMSLPVTSLDVEARMIEAVRVFDALQRTGRAWATDGPWYLSRLTNAESWARDVEHLAMGEALDRVVRAPRPDRDMIERAEEAAGWLHLVDEGDRRLVVLVLQSFASGRVRAPWSKILRMLGLKRGRFGLARRYAKAMNGLAQSLNRQQLAVPLAGREKMQGALS